MSSDPMFVFTADCHLEPHVWKNHPELAGDAYFSFQQIVDYTLEEGAAALLLGGDILNVSSPDPKTVGVVTRQMQRLEDAAVPCYYIVGQHEKHRLAQWLDVHSWPQHIDGETIDLNGHKIHGISFKPRTQLPEAIAAIPPDTDILMMHQVWQEIHGDMMNPEGAISDLPDSVDMLLTGDYHVHFDRPHHGIRVLSPGSIAMQAINEPPEKSFFAVTPTETGFDVVSVPLATRGFAHVELEYAQALDEFVDDIPHFCAQLIRGRAAIAKPIVRVSFNAEIPDAYTRLVAAIGDRCHFFPNPIRTRQTAEARQVVRRCSGPRGLVANLKRVMAEQTPGYDAVRRMLESDGQEGAPESVLDALEANFENAPEPTTRPAQRTSRRPRIIADEV